MVVSHSSIFVRASSAASCSRRAFAFRRTSSRSNVFLIGAPVTGGMNMRPLAGRVVTPPSCDTFLVVAGGGTSKDRCAIEAAGFEEEEGEGV